MTMNAASSGIPKGYASPEKPSVTPSMYSIAAGTTPEASTRSIAEMPASVSR